MIATAQAFYAQLAQNNSKDWWEANRGTYVDVLKPQALALLEDMAPTLSLVTETPIKTKLFRPHRDVRFSKDKTPYQTHLHMMWILDTPARQNPVFFFGIGVDYVTVGAGMMGFEKPVLEDWRKFADLDTKRVLGIMDDIGGRGFTLRAPELKRVPSGFAPDHVAADLLRMKGCVATIDISGTTDMRADMMTGFMDVAPLNALLLQVAEA